MAPDLKDKIREGLLSQYNALLSKGAVDEEKFKDSLTQIIEGILSRLKKDDLPEQDKKRIISELVDEFCGLGPIEALLKDQNITEIMINGPKKIYIEKQGKKLLSDTVFDSEQQLMAVIHKILSTTRRRVDESSPYTDLSLKDGSRVNIIISPLSLGGPTVTIRRFLKELRTAEDLIRMGTLDKRMSDFLIACIKTKANIIFAGATGAGKTTTLNVFSSYISNDERIVTIEDTAELHLNQDHVVRLEARQPSVEGKGEISIRNLFINSLRMRPDRIILGEIRDVAALDMLQAICSGHTGSLSVIHAKSPQDCLYRLETMILTSGIPITLDVIHRQIAAAIQLFVQQEQLPDGSRKVTNITQVNGLRDGRVVLEDIFTYESEDINPEGRINGKWKASGVIPSFYPTFKKWNIDLPKEIFNKD